MTAGMIYMGQEFGIDFFDENDVLVKEMSFAEDGAKRDALYDALGDDENHQEWPETAVRITGWHREVYRQPMSGVDYGRGSVKRRFGGGYVPRSAYQYHGE